MTEPLRGWGAPCETRRAAEARPRLLLSRRQRLDLTQLVVVGIAASACVVVMGTTRPLLAARGIGDVSLVPAITATVDAGAPSSIGQSVLPAPGVRRQPPHTLRLASYDVMALASPLAPQAPRPGATVRPRSAIARFFMGNGKYRVQPFPTVAAPN